MFKLNTNQESDISLACPAFPISMILVGKPLLIMCPFLFCQWKCLKVQVCVGVFICFLIPSLSLESVIWFTLTFSLLFSFSFSNTRILFQTLFFFLSLNTVFKFGTFNNLKPRFNWTKSRNLTEGAGNVSALPSWSSPFIIIRLCFWEEASDAF